MTRRIVVVRAAQGLDEAWGSRSFAPARAALEALRVAGVEFDEGFHPVRVASRSWIAAAGFDYGAAWPIATYAIRADLADEDAAQRLRADQGAEVVGVFADPMIRPCAEAYCGATAVGRTADVAARLAVGSLGAAGCTGKGVRLAIVDTGIDGTRIPVVGGWAPQRGYRPGSARPDHGTMCAYDALIAAPEASVLDYALMRSEGATWSAFLSDAIAAFADLMDLIAREPGPLVVSNSWGMFDRGDDAPIGSPGSYSANPDHPFNQVTGSLVAAGADVFFAAGNCGGECPDGRCGTGDRGRGASIHGANSHPDVITVAAVTVKNRRLGYSSQGPGGLARRKPDLAAYSHFRGSGVFAVDGGTSAACPVAAGVATALRQRAPLAGLSPTQLKAVLQRTALDVQGDGWDYDLGYGVIDPGAALAALGLRPRPARKPAPKKRAGAPRGKSALRAASARSPAAAGRGSTRA